MAQHGTLYVDIISPERPLYSGEATAITAPAHDGEVGILPQHAAMVTKLSAGAVRVTRQADAGTKVDVFAVNQGFLQTSRNKVIIITEEAKQAKDINRATVEADIAKLESESESSGSAREERRAKLAWLKAQLKACEK